MAPIGLLSLFSLFLASIVANGTGHGYGRDDYDDDHCHGVPIPKVNGQLPVYSLGTPVRFPQSLLGSVLQQAAPGAQLHRLGEDQFAFAGDRLLALVNGTTGEAKVLPTLNNLTAAEDIDTRGVSRYADDEQLFPRDDTTHIIASGSALLGSTHPKDKRPSAPAAYLKHSWVQRRISAGDQDYPVCGPGSKASWGFGSNGQVHSLSYRWKRADHRGQNVQSIPTRTVAENILRQLDAANATGQFAVRKIDICFYDSGESFIQPVYRFTAVSVASSNSSRVATATIHGYVPLAQHVFEPIPTLSTDTSRQSPAYPSSSSLPPTVQKAKRGGPQIRIGRYIDRNVWSNPHFSQWYVNSWNFLDHLQAASASSALLLFGFGAGAQYLDSQYYWAYPSQFTSSKQSYIDSVHIADTEVHGNWHEFTTLYNALDYVQLSDIPSDGYGPGAGGSLAYWILHSCEVIPTPYDYSAANQDQAWAPWWTIFNGMHATVGYRTEMWIGDSVMPNFGSYIGLNAGFVSSWLNVVHDDTAAYVPVQTDNENPNGLQEPYGRAAAVAVCGHGDDIATNIDNLGRPGCLEMWWYDNN